MKLIYISGLYLLMGLASLYFSIVLSEYFIFSFLFSIAGILRLFRSFKKVEILDDGILVSSAFNLSKHYFTFNAIIEWEFINIPFGIGSKRIKLKDNISDVTLFDWKEKEIDDLVYVLRKKLLQLELIND